MLQKPVDTIELEDIELLISNKVPEGKTIEYKAEINLKKDEEKKEFLYDISSFANASGGDIIFGVGEGNEKGIPGVLLGIDRNMDELKTKMESMLRDCIVPRILNLKIKTIPLSNAKSILIIHIPKSFNSPHQVTYQGVGKFYSRSNSGKYILDVHELRSAFLFSETITQRMKNFVGDGISKIIAEETPTSLQNYPKIVLQFLPVSSFDSGHAGLPLDIIKNKIPLPLGASGSNQRTNFEGVLNFSRPQGYQKAEAYVQVYRSGILETVNADLLKPFDGKKLINADGAFSFEFVILNSIINCLKFLHEMNVPAPVFCFLTLIGVKDYAIVSTNVMPNSFMSNKIDREVLSLPEIVIQSYKNDFIASIKEWFDMIWNASGYSDSITFRTNNYVQKLVNDVSKGFAI